MRPHLFFRFAALPIVFAFAAAVFAGCGGDDSSNNETSDGGDGGSQSDATTGGGQDAGADTGSTEKDAATDSGSDAGGPAPALFSLNDDVFSATHAGNAWYLGGNFTVVDGTPARGLALLDTSGHPSTTCLTANAFDGVVEAVLQVGASLYVGGAFTRYKGVATSANHIAKLDATTCALDTTFSPPDNNGFGSNVNALAVSGTSLYAGGDFTTYRGASANRLAKLDLTTGALDTTFSPATNGFDDNVAALAVSGTSLYVGGDFTAYKGVAGSANGIAKLDATTGEIDTTFSPAGAGNNGFDDEVRALAVSGTSLYAGGEFTAYKGVANSANRLAKLDATTGAIDATFSPTTSATANGFDDGVHALAVSGTSLYLGGDFTAYKGAAGSANHVAKLDLTTGALDTTFSPATNGFNDDATALAVSGTSLYVGGKFTAYKGVAGSANGIAKLALADGALDAGAFLPPGANHDGFDRRVAALTVSGANVWVGGAFQMYGGASANHIVKVDDQTFAVDTTFSPPENNGFGDEVFALAANGTSLYVGGDFTTYRGASANFVAKLDLTTGALDTTFSPAASNGFDSVVYALAASGTSLYAGGDFTTYRGASANFVAKLDLTAGALDTTFSPAASNGFDSDVYVLAANGTSLYAGGDFSDYRGVARSANSLAKLDATTGAIDTTFSPPGEGNNGFEDDVFTLAVSGTSLYVGGDFTDYRGVARSANFLAKLDATTGAIDTTFSPAGAGNNGFDHEVDGLAVSGTSLYAGGYFTAYRGAAGSANSIAKLDPTSGALDTTFSPPANNGFDDFAQALASDETSLLVGGGFTTYRGAPASRAIVLDPTTGASQSP